MRQKWWTLAAAISLAYWFFGNLYEAVVIAPNWVVDSSTQMRRLVEFFVNTGPTLYFVPMSMLAVVLVWILAIVNRHESLRRDYRRAAVATAMLTAVNLYIIVFVITDLFDPANLDDAELLRSLAWQWNALNVIRMGLTAVSAIFVFQAFRKLDRAS